MAKDEAEDDGAQDLKADLKLLRKRPLRFAFGLKDAQTPVLLLHKSKSAQSLCNELRAQSGAKTATFGTAHADDKALFLTVEGPKLAGLDTKMRLFLRQQKLSLFSDVQVQDGAAQGAAPGGPAAAPPGASAAALAQTRAAAALPGGPGGPAVTNAENDALSGLSEEELRKKDLTQKNPKELFTPKYMDGLVGLKVKGANDPKLKDVMRQLEKGASGAKREQLIGQLAGLRGADPKELDAQYGRFLVLRDQQAAVQKKKAADGKDVDAVPALAEDVHGEFMGSNPQLVFGKVVGDAYGIDPVFGALLSPTGGMVGPGNTALHLDDDDPTGYHGIVHDAAGYLYNYHDQGPGYNYLGTEKRDTSDPLTGQQSGMRYWHEKMDPGPSTAVMNGVIDYVYVHKDAFDEAKKTFDTAKKVVGDTVTQIQVDAEKALDSARNTVNQAIDTALTSAAETAKEAGTALEQAANDVSNAASEAANSVKETAVETYDSAKETVGNVADAASEKLNSAWSYVWS